MFLDIEPSAFANLCHSIDLVTSWISSARILHHHAKRVFLSDCNWNLVHMSPLRPQPLPANCLDHPPTSWEMLERLLPDGKQPDLDKVWMAELPRDRLNAKVTKPAPVHCEAMLMALAFEPSVAPPEIVQVCTFPYIRSLSS